MCAAALAAGALTSMAQGNVYSLNIVGYVNVPLATGYNLIANPLDNGTNDLNSLFPNATLGDTVYTFNGTTFNSAVFISSWSPDPVLPPGVGFFYQASGPATNTFVGNVLTGNLTNHVAAGYSIVASQVPQADTLENLNYPGQIGDTAYYWNNGSYSSSVFISTWSPDTIVGVGQGFFINASSPETWWRVFNP